MHIILSSFLCQHVCSMGINRDLSGVESFKFQDCKMLKENKHAGIRNQYRSYSLAVTGRAVDTVRLSHISAYKASQEYGIPKLTILDKMRERVRQDATSELKPSLIRYKTILWHQKMFHTLLSAFLTRKTIVRDFGENFPGRT